MGKAFRLTNVGDKEKGWGPQLVRGRRRIAGEPEERGRGSVVGLEVMNTRWPEVEFSTPAEQVERKKPMAVIKGATIRRFQEIVYDLATQ